MPEEKADMCAANVDCAEITGGCCMVMTILEVAEDPFFTDENMAPVAGDEKMMCAQPDAGEGEASLYEGFSTWWNDKATDEDKEAWGAYPEDSFDDWMEANGEDYYTWENTFASWYCMADGATNLAAGAATVLAL